MVCCCAQAADAALWTVVISQAPPEGEARIEPVHANAAAAADAPKAEAEPRRRAEACQAPRVFEALLRRPAAGAPFGWALDMLNPDALHIESVAGDARTAVARYNASARAGLAICAGDFITRVDGAGGSARTLSDALVRRLQVKVTIQRPERYVIELAKGDRPLGVDLSYTSTRTNIYIVSVCDGVVKEQAPEVSKGHRIVRVNGKALPPKEMVEALNGAELTVELIKAPRDLFADPFAKIDVR